MKVIPNFSSYLIDENARVFSLKTNAFLSGSINGSKYHFYHLYDDFGNDRNIGAHRLMAMTYLELPDNYEELVVNHKDGNKLNNDIDNLEWCTHTENLVHAGLNGLSSKAKHVQVYDIYSNTVYFFSTMIECARYYGISKDAVSYRCLIGPERLFPGGLQFRSPATKEPFPTIPNIEKALKENGTLKALLVKDLQTGLITEFPKMSEAALMMNVKPSTISCSFERLTQPIIRNRYQLKKVIDTEDWLEPTKYGVEQKVIVYNSVTKEEREYTSAREAAKANGLKPTALSYRLQSEGKKIFSDGKTYKRL